MFNSLKNIFTIQQLKNGNAHVCRRRRPPLSARRLLRSPYGRSGGNGLLAFFVLCSLTLQHITILSIQRLGGVFLSQHITLYHLPLYTCQPYSFATLIRIFCKQKTYGVDLTCRRHDKCLCVREDK